MKEEKHVVFRVNGELYSLNIELVRAIEQQYSIIPLPEGPANIKGMINLRGEIIPIYSLRARFHMEEVPRTRDTQLVIAKHREIQLAFEVDSVVGISNITEEQIKDIPIVIKGDATNYIGGLVSVGDDIVVEISMQNIMSESEWHSIEDLIHKKMDPDSEDEKK